MQLWLTNKLEVQTSYFVVPKLDIYTLPNENCLANIHFVQLIVIEEKIVNQFHTYGLFLYLLKTLENQRFSDVFRDYRKKPVG